MATDRTFDAPGTLVECDTAIVLFLKAHDTIVIDGEEWHSCEPSIRYTKEVITPFYWECELRGEGDALRVFFEEPLHAADTPGAQVVLGYFVADKGPQVHMMLSSVERRGVVYVTAEWSDHDAPATEPVFAALKAFVVDYLDIGKSATRKRRGGRPRNRDDDWAWRQVNELGRIRPEVYREWLERIGERAVTLSDPWESFCRAIRPGRGTGGKNRQ